MASRDSDAGSMTPSELSDAEERSDRDSDYESDEAEHNDQLNIHWTGYGRKTPVITFKPDALLQKKGNYRTVGERYHLAYKFGNSECKLIRNVLNFHGFHEVHPNSSDYNFVWTGGHLKPFTLRSLTEFQKINHFPRSYELTRKDRLYKNLQRMQQIKGFKHFDIIPQSFILPSEYQDFCAAFLREKGTWIVKPVASSRGRGVFLCNHPDQVPLDENLIVSRYVPQPLLIDSFKFDIRLYVCVTSYDPLIIYLFEEGLTRFATVKFEKGGRHIRNQCMHLTNYSVNKKSDDYVRNDDADIEDYGNKWSLGALLRYLRSHGKDTAALMMRIEDVIIKCIMSVELPIATACKMFMPFRGNCFELYGFDVLVDENMKPWVLEVNLSPSLACDAPLDLKIKTNMICDMMSLTGIVCHDPMMRTLQQSRRNQEVTAKIAARAKSARFRPSSASVPSSIQPVYACLPRDTRLAYGYGSKQRPQSAGSVNSNARSSSRNSDRNSAGDKAGSMVGLTSEEIKIIRRVKEEDQRAGGWVRIFPTADTWDLYSSFLQYSTTNNLMLHSRLYPERHKTGSGQARSVPSTSMGSRARISPVLKATYKSTYSHLGAASSKSDAELAECYAEAILRTRQYERKLGTKRSARRRLRRRPRTRVKDKVRLVQGVAEEGEGEEEDKEEDIGDMRPPGKSEVAHNPPVYQSGSGIDRQEMIEVDVEKSEKPPVHPANRDDFNKVTDKLPPKGPPVSVTDDSKKEEEVSQHVNVEPPPPPEPRYPVVELLQKGCTLSKVQARSAFAMYLIRVQQRLISEQDPSSQEDIDALNEQMDLVLRFLKRAAVNLQQQFKVVVPSRKLPLTDRRRILAKQLGDFVHIYNKLLRQSQETEQIRVKKLQEQKHGKIAEVHPKTDANGLCEKKFERFVSIASEGELEEVLTTYTKINKSASIFLGGGSSTKDQPRPATEPVTSTQESEVKHQELAVEAPVHRVTGWEDSVEDSLGTSAHESKTKSEAGRTPSATYATPSQSSYANAVQVYTQKLAVNRPRSASSQRSATTGQRQRPMSAVHQRPMSSNPYATTDPTVDSYNDQAIQDALQRLSLRQQSRQYSAHNGTTLIGLENGGSRPQTGHRETQPRPFRTFSTGDINSIYKGSPAVQTSITVMPGDRLGDTKGASEEQYPKSRPPTGSSYRRVDSASGRRRPVQTNVNLQNANATFNSFIDDSDKQNLNSGGSDSALNHVTSVLANNYPPPSSQATKHQLIQQQQALKQQSKAMLEQSKAKHQAMVAQAYAMQKSFQQRQQSPVVVDVESAVQKYAPKPPTQPHHKRVPLSHRVQRNTLPEEFNFNFNNSLKHDAPNGLSQPSSAWQRHRPSVTDRHITKYTGW